MRVWDFSREETWPEMERRAAQDAFDAVDYYWPYGPRGPGEASPEMPQDLDQWARQLTMDFLRETQGYPKWVRHDTEMAHGIYLTVRNAYYRHCRPRLEQHIIRRIMDSHKLPRQTLPPAAQPERPVTYPLPPGSQGGNQDNGRHASHNSNEGA